MDTYDVLVAAAADIYDGNPLSDTEATEFDRLVSRYAAESNTYPSWVLQAVLNAGWCKHTNVPTEPVYDAETVAYDAYTNNWA